MHVKVLELIFTMYVKHSTRSPQVKNIRLTDNFYLREDCNKGYFIKSLFINECTLLFHAHENIAWLQRFVGLRYRTILWVSYFYVRISCVTGVLLDA